MGWCSWTTLPAAVQPPFEPCTIWRRVKGFLMPRRRYGSVEELRKVVTMAMERLREQMGQVVLQRLCAGTYLA